MELLLDDLLASLTAIGRSLQERFDPRRFLGEFSSHVQRLIPHDRLVIAYLEDTGSLSIFAEHAVSGELAHRGRYTTEFDPSGRYSAEESVLQSVLAGQGMLVRDLQQDVRFACPDGQPVWPFNVGVRSRVAAPLESRGRIIGSLLAAHFADNYAEAHFAAVRRVADLIAPFIENIVLLHRERRRRKRLAALAGLACVFGASLNIKARFDQLVDPIRRVLDFDMMGMTLDGASGRGLELVSAADGPSVAKMPDRIALDHLSFATALAAGEPVLIQDAALEFHTDRAGDRAILDGGSRACLAVPLWFCEVVDGFLFFGKRRPAWYDSADVEVASAIAAQLVVAVQHQRLAEEQQRLMAVESRARRLEQQLDSLRHELGDRSGFDQVIGRAPALKEALSAAAKVAPTDTTVLLTGESGTGKELVARAIHHASARPDGPFVAINCAALPETLVESELFGHEKGAFTGADKQKPGRFELAAGGTLLLDEVGELPPLVQAKLLRVLQEHEFQRVGGTATLRADVRLIAATNKSLKRAVEEGRFREDLYYRLNVFSVHLPPLRERTEDVLALATHFMRELGQRIGKGEPELSAEARELLLTYPWPGNIRELENAIERALILSEDGRLTAAHLGLPVPPVSVAPDRTSLPPIASPVAHSLAEAERRAILAALEQAQGNKTRAAASLGITRTKLYTRLKRLDLPS